MKSLKKNAKSIDVPFLEGVPVSRSSRMGDVVKRELAVLLASHVRDPRFRGVSITRVSLSSDLGHACVCISTCFPQVDVSIALSALNQARGYFRSKLASGLPSRRVPRLKFVIDEGAQSC